MKLKESKQGFKYLELTSSENPCQDFLIFHGYGADCFDLKFLQTLHPKGRWIFPQAPLDQNQVPSWFPLPQQNDQEDFKTTFFKRKKEMLSFIEELFFKKENLILGGFSQGAMLSSALCLMDFKPKALFALSGGMLFEKVFSFPNPAPPFFQSHGRRDPILSFLSAKTLFQILSENQSEGEFYAFEGGHEVPPEVIQKLEIFLKKFYKI